MANARNDGKYLEEAVEEFLDKFSSSGQKYRRLPDARAARGRIPRQPSDFFLSSYVNGPMHLECKTSKSKTRRLSSGEFPQYPDMKAWDAAGVRGAVLIHFYNLDELHLMFVRDMKAAKSWVFTDSTLLTTDEEIPETLLHSIGWSK